MSHKTAALKQSAKVHGPLVLLVNNYLMFIRFRLMSGDSRVLNIKMVTLV